ncbi:hypothetical protein Pyrde_1414 [Pyrodictium delaneyi]|uniref:SAM-dependent chlorinase/fluorinase n=1 Tax=Pyrodictium delaneyi TaxID=1273541 RepID=A0A0P0N3D9_9CREN|nr:hypothetical protein Pyrde_1414 [Pyrodictium delaneyi]
MLTRVLLRLVLWGLAPRGRGLVVYMSDFGWRDPYVGIVKGVIESIGMGRIRVIDLTHDIAVFSVISGAYVLYTSYRYYPPGTVFLAVVDPGVGTERKPVAIETRNYYFVGPDNGLLYPAAAEDGILRVHVLDNEAVYRKPVSMSFHGRDIFSPAAALLALGVGIEALGSPMEPGELVKLSLRKQCSGTEEEIEAEVVYIDRFGNAALGLERGCLNTLCRWGEVEVVSGKRKRRARCLPVFSHAEPGELVFYMNSLGFPELAVNLGSAAEELGLQVGSRVVMRPVQAKEKP